MEAKLEGDIPALEKDLTLGNFEAGKSGTIDFVVTPKKTGKVEGKIRVSYEDEAMQQKTEEIPISVEVMEAQNEQADFSGENDEMARPRGTVLWPATALAVLLATALFAAAKARKKIRDRKMEDAKREEQDDDWDDVFPEDEGGEEDENGTGRGRAGRRERGQKNENKRSDHGLPSEPEPPQSQDDADRIGGNYRLLFRCNHGIHWNRNEESAGERTGPDGGSDDY